MAGRKINRANMARIQQIADHAYAMGAKLPPSDATPLGAKADMSLNDQLEVVARAVYANAVMPMDGYCCIEETFDTYVIIEVCQSGGVETYWRADYRLATDGSVTLAPRDSWVQVEEVWTPVTSAAKAGVILEDAAATHYASIKALGDRQLQVLVSYHGHRSGKDAHGEYFSPRTDFAAEDFPTPPLLYYHGYDEGNRKMAKPVVTGKFVSRRDTPQGHALIYKLKAGRYADLQWAAAQKGACVVSPGTVGHLIRKAPDGELLYWPLAEVSAWDYSDKRQPANMHSVAVPALKALYLSEGLTLPTSLETTPPEAAGDAASAGARDIDPIEAGKAIAHAVADAMLALHKGRS